MPSLEASYVLANAMRHVVDMVRGHGVEDLKKVYLDPYLELIVGPTQAPRAKKMFLSWYRDKYHPELTSDWEMDQEFRKENPLAACGMLSEFAGIIEHTVAVSIILDQAADYIKRFGWIQGASHNSSGFDLVGAVEYTILRNVQDKARAWLLWQDALAMLREYLQTSLLVGWNDAPGRTAREVIQALKATSAGIKIIRP